jgi:hypothetical protein
VWVFSFAPHALAAWLCLQFACSIDTQYYMILLLYFGFGLFFGNDAYKVSCVAALCFNPYHWLAL